MNTDILLSNSHFVIMKKLFEIFFQFFKFALVGLLNTAISYGTYVILVNIGTHYVLANVLGFSLSVFNSYYWNNKYVFVLNRGRVWWKTFLKTYISYAGTGIVLSNILLAFWIDICGVSKFIAPLINLIIIIPINFFINKFWAYK